MNGGVASVPRLPRVLHIVSSTAFAGIERHVLRLTGGLVERGCDVALATPLAAERLRVEAAAAGVELVPPESDSRPFVLAVLAAFRSWRPDLVHVHDGRGAVVGAIGIEVGSGRIIRTQHFVQTASAQRSGLGGAGSRALHRQINRRVSGYIAVSHAALDAARQRGEIDSGVDTEVIGPGVVVPDADTVAYAKEQREALAHPTAAWMGRLEPERRLDVLIDAMPDILREVPGAKLSIAGAGKEEARLRARVEALGVSNAVSWLGWVAEPADVLAASHVLVNTLADEGFGMAMAEAMGFGLPVIAPARGASTEIVEDGVTGALVPPGDPVSLASAVTQMLRERGRAAEMGTRARDRAIDRFGVEHTVQATLAFYLRTLGQLHGDGTGEGAALLPQRSSR